MIYVPKKEIKSCKKIKNIHIEGICERAYIVCVWSSINQTTPVDLNNHNRTIDIPFDLISANR